MKERTPPEKKPVCDNCGHEMVEIGAVGGEEQFVFRDGYTYYRTINLWQCPECKVVKID